MSRGSERTVADAHPLGIEGLDTSGRDIDIAAKFFLGLADPTRLRILALLVEHDEMRVGDLVDAVGGRQGRVSSHLACLRHCGLVADRKEGRNVYYSVPDPRVVEFLPIAFSMIADNAAHIASCHRIEQ
ncbi:metalloregulator ArsR/SmtB family transcription factor [Iamia majanohamensis]|uniref:Metalloregulator ArsR/SmtB family transcription factor n=1 Tax=Iamia majanohamensis TaxID=467976 RepID=A0AAE9Y6X4_9ACTN|nr:metalloregulator ArsR/SmtB family transcription factor [Iamia majanohamensis]WCO68045.1 metalloregulator ArsR/SmtB family transcription factor [Iamia majanohamensis]